MMTIPTGIVTFLFTDIVESTPIAQKFPAQWESLRARHHAILRQAIETNSGTTFQIVGDGFCAAFHNPGDALRAALAAQHSLQAEEWSPAPVQVRMGIHTGVAQATQPGDPSSGYTGYITLARAQRVMSVAYGGQILLSSTSAELARESLPEGVTLLELDELQLKGFMNPERLWQASAPGLRSDFPPLLSLITIPNNLPTLLTPFIGRERDLETIQQRVADHRLVTLTGSGGVGKTRLAIETARQVLPGFAHGAWLVSLAPITNPDLLESAVASIFGVHAGPNRALLAALTDYLHEKRLLLVLDNCEHLIQACAGLAEHLLQRCPNLKILASSREALGIEGETALRVPSLSLPPAGTVSSRELEQYEAAQLFCSYAAAALPGFVLTDANAAAVAQVCCRLDGIPLALELAAARVKILKVEQIASRLDDAFRLLTGGSRTALPRQQTLRATLDWSYNLLSVSERKVLQRLSVFSGGCTLEAAEAVCSGEGIDEIEVLDSLNQLANKSLLSEREPGDQAHFYLLETTRQYAREKLVESGESEAVRQRHLDYYLSLAESAKPQMRSKEGLSLEARFKPDWDNFRVALEWYLGGKTADGEQIGLRLANAFYIVQWASEMVNNRKEHQAWLQRALELDQRSAEPGNLARAEALVFLGSTIENEAGYELMKKGLAIFRNNPAVDPIDLCDALNWLTEYAYVVNGDRSQARAFSNECISILRGLGAQARWYLGQALGMGCWAAIWNEDYPAAQLLGQESYTIYLEIGDHFSAAWCLRPLGRVAESQGDYKLARSYYEASLRHLQQVAPEAHAAAQRESIMTMEVLAILDNREGKYEEAYQRCEEIYSYHQDAGDIFAINRDLQHLGRNALALGDTDHAAEYLRQSLLGAQELKAEWMLARSLTLLAEVFIAKGNYPCAARLLGAVKTKSSGWVTILRDEYKRDVSKVADALGPEAAVPAFAEGRSMTIEQAAEDALKELDRIEQPFV